MNQQPLLQIMDYEQLKQQLMTLVGDIKSLDDAIKSIKPLTDIYKGASGSADSRKAQEDLIGANQKLKQTQDELIKSIQQYKTLQEQVTALQEKYAKMQNEGASGTAALKDRQRELNQEIQKTAQASNAAEGSIKQLRAQLSLLTAEYDKMSAAQRNTAAGTALKDQIAGQVTALKQLEAETGRFQRNVGNYTGAIQILERQLQQIKVKMDQFTQSGQGNSAEMQNLRKEHDLLEQALTRQTRGFSSLTMEVRNNERQLALMAEENMQGTEAFKQLQIATANAKREITIFNQEQKLLSSQAPTLAAATVAAKGLAGIYATGAGTAALFADGNEKVERELNKLVAIMTILQGLEEFHQLIEKKGVVIEIARITAMKLKNFIMTGSTQGLVANTAAMEVNTAATEATTVASKAASAAMVGLRLALIATGIGALLVLLPSIANAMSKTKDETIATSKGLDKLKESEEELTKSIHESSGAFVEARKNVNDVNEAILLATKGVISKKEAVDVYNKSLGDAMGQVKSLDEVEQKMADKGRVDAYIKMMTLKAAANYELEKASKKAAEAEEEAAKPKTEFKRSFWDVIKTSGGGMPTIGSAANDERQKVIGEQLEKSRKEVVDKVNKEKDFYQKIGEDLQNKANDLASKFGLDPIGQHEKETTAKKQFDPSADIAKNEEELLKLKSDFRKLDIDDQKKYLQQIVDDERNSYDLRINAAQLLAGFQKEEAGNESTAEENIIKLKLNRISELEKKAVSKRTDEEKKEILSKKVLHTELELAEAKHASKLEDISRDLSNKLKQINQQANEKAFKGTVDDIDHFKKEQELKNLEDETKALDELNKKFEAGDISVEEYNKQKEKIENGSTIKQLQNEYDAVQNLIDVYNFFGVDTIDLEKKALEIKKKMSEARIKIDYDEAKKKEELQKKYQEELKKGEEKAFELGKAIVDGVYVRQINAIQKQIDLNTQWKDAEVERINTSTLSEQDKAAKLAQINASAQAKQDQLDKQKRDAQLRQAKFDREASILKVVEETAISVMTDNSNPITAWKVPYDIALGALQIGAILAKPLPTYYTGTKSAQGGLALTDEKGAEMYIEPSGKIFMGNDSPTLRNIKAGTEIVPHDQVNEKIHQMILQGAINRGDIVKNDEASEKLDHVAAILRWQTAEFKKALEKQKTPKVVINHNGAFNDWKRKNIYE